MHRRVHAGIFVLLFVLLILLSACSRVPDNFAPPKISPTGAGSTPGSSEAYLPPSNPIPPATNSGGDVSPASDPVRIIDSSGFKDEANNWYFYGLIRNDTKDTIYDVQVEVKLLDDAGKEIYTYTTDSMFTYLAPGEVSPFSDFISDPYPNGQTMQAKLIGYQVAGPIGKAKLDFRGITIWSDGKNSVFLAGEAYNGNSTPVEINTIAGSLINDAGKLVSASAAFPYLIYIEPNTASPFVIMFDTPVGLGPDLTRYSLYADVLSSGFLSTYDITVSEQQRKYQDSYGNMHLVGSVTNKTPKPMNITLLAGVYDQDGNVLDANIIYPPLPINPGASFAYDFNLWGPMDHVPAAYEKATNYKVFVDWLSTSEAFSPVIDLSSENDASVLDGTNGYFKGTVTNNSGKDIATAVISVALYDKTSGDLVATNLGYLSDSLPSGGSAAYEVNLFLPNNVDINNVNIVITAYGQ